MDRAKFFAAVRVSLFGGSLTSAQVEGMEALLDACSAYGVNDPRHIAYVLATPMIETGGTFEPITESLNYSVAALSSKFANRMTAEQASRFGRTSSRPADQVSIGNIIYGGDWGRRNLGNTQPGDGYAFRGRGLPQLTGRRLYDIAGKLISLDLISNPDAACDLQNSAKIMVVAMRDGIFTGKKLADYFTLTSSDWVNARRIVNSLDRAADIAVHAKAFNAALEAAR